MSKKDRLRKPWKEHRNAPCECGSGKKAKDCCMGIVKRQRIQGQIIRKQRQIMDEE